MNSPLTPDMAARLWDAVTAAHRLSETIEQAAVRLRSAGYKTLAKRLLAEWAALGAEPTEQVYALPPEPPVGKTVRVLDGTYAGRTYECLSGDGGGEEYPPLWMDQKHRACMAWSDLLRIAGPAGVRVVEDGEGRG